LIGVGPGRDDVIWTAAADPTVSREAEATA
jgi:hypothetical protein